MSNAFKTPNVVSFTGSGELTDTNQMVKLTRACERVEWGILAHPEKIHKPKNPGWGWFERLGHMGMDLGLHLCGKQVFRELLHPASRHSVIYRVKLAKNIQVNINARDDDFDPEQVMEVYDIIVNAKRDLILQYNDRSKRTIKTWIEKRRPDLSKLILLYDASGGDGITPSSWPEPQEEFEVKMRRRFAGGLSIDNMLENLAKISELQMVSETGYEICMESNLFTAEGVFDVDLCNRICDLIYME